MRSRCAALSAGEVLRERSTCSGSRPTSRRSSPIRLFTVGARPAVRRAGARRGCRTPASEDRATRADPEKRSASRAHCICAPALESVFTSWPSITMLPPSGGARPHDFEQRRRLAAARFADECERFAFAYVEAHAVDGLTVPRCASRNPRPTSAKCLSQFSNLEHAGARWRVARRRNSRGGAGRKHVGPREPRGSISAPRTQAVRWSPSAVRTSGGSRSRHGLRCERAARHERAARRQRDERRRRALYRHEPLRRSRSGRGTAASSPIV